MDCTLLFGMVAVNSNNSTARFAHIYRGTHSTQTDGMCIIKLCLMSFALLC